MGDPGDASYPPMVEVPWRQTRRHAPTRISCLEPEDFHLETTTVWSFPERGCWATHTAQYRGNWAPEVPRNLILRYTQTGEIVLDPMMGGGTTLIECLLLSRQGIGVDVEPAALEFAGSSLNFGYWPVDWPSARDSIRLFHGDARRLDRIPDASIHLVTLHPPYSDIIPHGAATSLHNLSRLSLDRFIPAIREVAEESFRVLRPDRHCAILMGDTRRGKHFVPLSVRVLEQFLDVGFILRENIVKLQHRMKTTREKWSRRTYDFYLIAHEHLYVFRKPAEGEKLKDHRYSVKWW